MIERCTITMRLEDGRAETRALRIDDGRLVLKRPAIPAGTRHVEIHSSDFTAAADGDGYFVIPNLQGERMENNGHAALIFFRERADAEIAFPENTMPVYAICRGGSAILAVVDGMSLDYTLVCGICNGGYYCYPRFFPDADNAGEDISIRFILLSGRDADYSGIARRYRQYQLERGACRPIRERMKDFPVVAEAAQGPEVRLRLAWKPVPPPVLEQEASNEPPMHVAITFERAEAIVEEFHRQGIEDAEFCLVGWNKSGHDGCFPDLFPVEPELGGERGLKRLIRKARAYGYLISPHVNVMDSYRLAGRFDRNNLSVRRDGSDEKGGCWGGGQSYRLCPAAAHEKYAVDDMADLQALGFRGALYMDVMTMLRPTACHHPAHPLTRREAGEWRGNSLRLARERIGASASEGAWDFCIGSLDYVLYAVFNPDAPLPELCDRAIPLWHLVYHGIVLYNTSCGTVNSAVNPDREAWLRNVEAGGRPLAYFNAKFLTAGRNWMGDVDCSCATDGQLRQCVTAIKREYEEYRQLRRLQFEFMEEHEMVSPGVVKVRYSDGTVVWINHRHRPYNGGGLNIPSATFRVFGPTVG